ncbi:MAG: YlxR family protein [Oscillospiraceae bacterium]|nr:YlxR family protein [Oscillospiraceae bacterium]
MLTTKKIPMRKCVGCGEMKPKRELTRLVRSPEGEVSIDKTGKKNGRGAYLCDNPKCFKAAVKAKRFERAFGVPVEKDVFESLEIELRVEN